MTFYEILGVPRNATQDEIRNAYRELARRYHPDGLGTADESARAEAEENIKAINAAFHALGDPDRRRAYNRVMWTGSDPARQYRYRSPRKESPDPPPTNGYTNGYGRDNSLDTLIALAIEIERTRIERSYLSEKQQARRTRLWISAGFTCLIVYFLMAFGIRFNPSPAELPSLFAIYLSGELIAFSVIVGFSGLRFPRFQIVNNQLIFVLTALVGLMVTSSSLVNLKELLRYPASVFGGIVISTAVVLHALLAARLAKYQESLFEEEVRRIDQSLADLERRYQALRSKQRRRDA